MQRLVIAAPVVGWCLFVTSFFLPALLGSPGHSGHFFGGNPGMDPMQGWEAAMRALMSVTWGPEFYVHFLWGLTNLAMLASPVFFVLRAPSRRRIVVYVLSASSVLDVLAYFKYGSKFTAGYFLWCSSLLLVTFAFDRAQRIDRMTRLICVLSAMVVATGFIVNVQAQQPVAKGRSKTWSVSVVRATRAVIPSDRPDQHYFLTVDLQFKYLGPDGEIAAPAIAVVDEKGGEYRPILGQYPGAPRFRANPDFHRWLGPSATAEQTKLFLQRGEKFGDGGLPAGYTWPDPIDSKELKLVFADVPPIALKPTHDK